MLEKAPLLCSFELAEKGKIPEFLFGQRHIPAFAVWFIYSLDVFGYLNKFFSQGIAQWILLLNTTQNGFAGVFRCDDTSRRINIHRGMSQDRINLKIDPDPIQFINPTPDFPESIYKYDPRIVSIEGRYYITWGNGYHGPGIGLG